MRYTSAHWGTYVIDGDRLRPLDDDPNPSRIGQGWVSAARNPKTRILSPCVRRGWLAGDKGATRADDSFVEVSWDRAVALAAREVERVRTEHGNGAIYAGSYGWASAGRFHHAQSQLRRFMNLAGGYVSSRNTYSFAAAEVLLPIVTGMDVGEFENRATSWPLVAEHCELLVAFGGISGRTAQITSSGTTRHEVEGWLSRLKARVINVSPRRSDLAGSEHLSIRPGSDTALMLALCHTLLTEDLHDQAFVSKYTSGWATFRAYLLGAGGAATSAEWAAPICDIPAPTIRTLAREMAAKRTMISVAWSLQRGDHGEQPLWAGLALAAMLGQLGRPGTGFSFGYGSTTPVGRPTRLHRWPSVPQGQNIVQDWIPVARIADMLLRPGDTYVYEGETRTYPHIRLVWWAGGNPFHHHQDLNQLCLAWARPETVIVQDHSWTATARRADIVLPATTPLERADIMMNKQDPTLIYMSPMFKPMGQSQDDHQVLRAVAAELGFEAEFTQGRDTEGWLRWLWTEAIAAAGAAGVALPEFDKFREVGRFDMPDAYEEKILFEAFVADPTHHPLATESGRITLFNERVAAMDLPDCPGHPTWLPPQEAPDGPDAGSYYLISGQPETRLHGQNESGSVATADKIAGCEPCYIHPGVAKRHGVTDGDILLLSNARGACLAGVRIDAGIREDCVALATGAWFDPFVMDGRAIERSGNPNVLTRDAGCSRLSQGNMAHSAVVCLERWIGPLPGRRVMVPPIVLTSDEANGSDRP